MLESLESCVLALLFLSVIGIFLICIWPLCPYRRRSSFWHTSCGCARFRWHRGEHAGIYRPHPESDPEEWDLPAGKRRF